VTCIHTVPRLHLLAAGPEEIVRLMRLLNGQKQKGNRPSPWESGNNPLAKLGSHGRDSVGFQLREAERSLVLLG
jgi:hypothetical protein